MAKTYRRECGTCFHAGANKHYSLTGSSIINAYPLYCKKFDVTVGYDHGRGCAAPGAEGGWKPRKGKR